MTSGSKAHMEFRINKIAFEIVVLAFAPTRRWVPAEAAGAKIDSTKVETRANDSTTQAKETSTSHGTRTILAYNLLTYRSILKEQPGMDCDRDMDKTGCRVAAAMLS